MILSRQSRGPVMVVLVIIETFLEPKGIREMSGWRMDALSGTELGQVIALGDSYFEDLSRVNYSRELV